MTRSSYDSSDSDAPTLHQPRTILAYAVPIVLGLAVLVGGPVACMNMLAQQTTDRARIVCNGDSLDKVAQAIMCDRVLKGIN